jgi:hypothetical protein
MSLLFRFVNVPPKGVKSIDTNVEAKTVVVEADESVSPQLMLEKLQKVGYFMLRLALHSCCMNVCVLNGHIMILYRVL